VRAERIQAGTRPNPALAGAVLTRDLRVGAERWPKGRRLSPDDLAALAADASAIPEAGVTVLVAENGDLHEDEAALRLAAAIGGRNLATRGPAESRVDLLAATDGVLHVRTPALERLNRIDPLEVFTAFDGSVVAAGDLVASVKVAPHLVPEAVLLAGEAVARRGGPLVRVRPYRDVRIGVLVKGDVAEAARRRFEASIGAKVRGLRARLGEVRYVPDADAAVAAALGELTGDGPAHADIVLTAGGGSTDPSDALFAALETLGGRMVRRGVPSHPGSMLWLAVVGETAVVGLPSCGAYSMATAADLLLPRLVAGQPPTAATVARLAHGGILARTQRFRFPAYARDLEAPEG
jgi:hypothetical protein